MLRRLSLCVAILGLSRAVATLPAAEKSTKAAEHWEIQGDLSEVCTCAVPCTCNLDEGPSPHHYCRSIFSLSIEKGHYGDVKLDGLHLAGVHGNKTKVWYVDAHSNPEQAAALRAIADHILKSDHVETAAIEQRVGDAGNHLKIGDRGEFEADYVIGLDGKTPVVVENNTTWNIPRSIKGKTKYVHYKDQFGNKMEFSGTNSNEGKFDWTDETEKYM